MTQLFQTNGACTECKGDGIVVTVYGGHVLIAHCVCVRIEDAESYEEQVRRFNEVCRVRDARRAWGR